MPGEGEQVERGERHGQIGLAVPEIVFKLVAVVFQDVEAFVLDLPPCAAASGDLGDVALGDRQRGNEGHLVCDCALGVEAVEADPVDQHGVLAVAQRNLLDEPVAMRLARLAFADLDLMTREFGSIDEVVERLVRGLLAGEDEIVAVVREPLDHALAGEQIVAQIHRSQGLQARAVLHEPAFDRVALAVLLLGAVLFDDELRRERDHLGMSRRDNRRAQHGMIAFDLAVAALARLAMRAGDPLAAKILGPVEGHERSAAQPAESLAHRRFEQQTLRVLEAGRKKSRIRAVEHVPDIIVGRDLLDAKKGLAVRPSLTFSSLR